MPEMESRSPQNKIRVCFVFDFWRGRAGAELQLALLLEHLDRRRVEPFVLILRGDEQSILELPDCPVYCLKMGWLRSFSTFSKARELRQFFKQNSIDIVQALVIDNPSLVFLASVGKWSGVKKVFGFRVDIGFWMTSRQACVGRFAHKFLVDKVIANAEACKSSIIEQENARAENVVVIPNLIDTTRFANIPTWTAAHARQAKRIGIVSNLKPVKGTDVFIDAAKIVLQTYPDAQFELAGTAGTVQNTGQNTEVGLEFGMSNVLARQRRAAEQGRSRLPDPARVYQSQIERLGIAPNVRLLGSVSDVPAFLSTLDVAVLSSRSEGLPNAIMEYMAAGRPCVVTDVGGCRELIRHEQNGLLVPPENPVALAEGIADLLAHPDRAEQFAVAARKDVSEKYEAAVLANRWCEIYEDVLADRAYTAPHR